jgi:hypothetical protein
MNPSYVNQHEYAMIGTVGGILVSGSLLTMIGVKFGNILLMFGIAIVTLFINNPMLYKRDAEIRDQTGLFFHNLALFGGVFILLISPAGGDDRTK